MVSVRVQEEAMNFRRQNAARPPGESSDRGSSRSSYLSATGGYESDIDERGSVTSLNSKWGMHKGAKKALAAEQEGSDRSPSQGPRARDWKTRAQVSWSTSGNYNPEGFSKLHQGARMPSMTASGPNENVAAGGEWFAALDVQDDLELERPMFAKAGRPSLSPSREMSEHLHRSETLPLDDDCMRPISPYFDSQQDLAVAMGRLTTGHRAVEDQSAISASPQPQKFAVSQVRAVPRVEPRWKTTAQLRDTDLMDDLSLHDANSSRVFSPSPVAMHSDEEDDLYKRDDAETSKPSISFDSERLLARLNDVYASVSSVNEAIETMRQENKELKDRLDNLELPAAFRLPAKKSNQRKPYVVPRRRSEDTKSRAKNVRKELDFLLDAHEGHPFASEQQVDAFAEEIKRNPALRCCSTANFRIDVNGGARSPWNKSAQLVFTEHYLVKHCVLDEAANGIAEAFYARVKSIKATRIETAAQKLAKVVYVRKYSLFQRRVETLAFCAALRGYVALLQALSVEGMSSDEESSGTQLHGGLVAVKNPQYIVKTPRWRSKELTAFLHLVDSIGLLQRRSNPTKQRGNWARVRVHDPRALKLSNKTTFPKNLPRNAYDDAWLRDFQNVRLSVDPAPAINLNITPEILESILNPRPEGDEV